MARVHPSRSWSLPLVLAALILTASSACGETAEPDDTQGAAASVTTTVAGDLSEQCKNAHAGHSAMMWNPTMADEMLDAGCGWPYEPFLVELDGGRDSPDIDVEFTPARYADLWTAISTGSVGVCSVGTDVDGTDLPDEARTGRAFGFDYQLGPQGCPDATPTGSLTVSEYGTEAQRDAAAVALAADGTEVFVVGRWVISLGGDTPGIASALEQLGAVAVD